MSGSKMQRLLRSIDTEWLQPDPTRVQTARARANGLCEALNRSPAWMYDVESIKEHGSLSRGTSVRGFDDIDILVFLNEQSLRTRSGGQRTAGDTVSRMAQEVKRQRAGLVAQGHVNIRCQDHSIGVEYPASQFRVDLVPAIRTGLGVLIPEKSSMRWVPTFPDETSDRVYRAARMDRTIKRRIRLMKAWSRARGHNVRIPSFAIETIMVERALRGQNTRIRSLIQEIANHDNRRRLNLLGTADSYAEVCVRDPLSQVNLAEELDVGQRKRLVGACRKATHQFDAIEAHFKQGSQRLARVAAEKLFLGSWRTRL